MTHGKTDFVESVADAVMHEGLMLYPYRPSALKNWQRWNFGVLMPPAFCERAKNGDRSALRIECLAEAEADARLSIKLRFMQLRSDGEPEERTLSPEPVALGRTTSDTHWHEFSSGAICGLIGFTALALDQRTSKLTIAIQNLTPFSGELRDQALGHALLSCHALLSLERGAFLSLVDAPADLLARADCQNVGVWPVLVGREGDRSRMLASPIILYDYPKLAPQSPTAMFDGTEIDELLSLRVQTLTPEEKAELRRHPRTAAMLDRIDGLANSELAALHGTWTPSHDAKKNLKRGDAVILRPKRRADIFDLALAGRRATVSSIERDFEDRVHVCVIVDDDPGRDLGLEGKPGHRFFFDLDEVDLP